MGNIILPFITLLGWGLWGFFSKISTKFFKWYEYYIFSTIISLFFSLCLFFAFRNEISLKIEGILYLFLALFTGSTGTITFYLALTKGKASIIVPLTSLYPAFTVILAKFFLKEELTLRKSLGIILAIIAIFILSSEDT
ncbi:MAG: EamA family transporter [Candidatus Hydrothermales bacterium]